MIGMDEPERKARDVAASSRAEPHPSDNGEPSFTVGEKSCGSCKAALG
jgi:hypothetical protein